MNIDQSFTYKRFNEAKDGALLVAVIGGTSVVRGMKAYWPKEAGGREEYLVTVGPFGPDHQVPTVYRPDHIDPNWVLELSSEYVLAPSLDPADICPDLPPEADTLGTLLIAEEGTYLAAKPPPSGPPVLLWNIETGEMLGRPENGRFCCVLRWCLVRQNGAGVTETLPEFHSRSQEAPA